MAGPTDPLSDPFADIPRKPLELTIRPRDDDPFADLPAADPFADLPNRVPRGVVGDQPPSGAEPTLAPPAEGPAPVGEGALPGGPTPPAVEAPSLPASQLPLDFNILDPLQRSFITAKEAKTVADFELGRIDAPTAAQQILEYKRQKLDVNQGERYKEGTIRLRAPEYQGLTGRLRWVKDYPDVAAEYLAESGVQMGASGLGAVVGGLVGAPAGLRGIAMGIGLGAGLPSAVSEYTNHLLSHLEQEEGIDINSEEQLQSALANPEVMARARRAAQIKGGIVGGFDALTAFIGVRGGGRAVVNTIEGVIGKQAVEKSAARQVLENAVADAAVIGGPGGAAGEVASTVAVGRDVDPLDPILEYLGEVSLGLPQSAVEAGASMIGPRAAAPEFADLMTAGAVPEIPTFEQAEQEGRTFYAFVEDEHLEKVRRGETNVPVTIAQDYEEAEKTMGAGDPRRGRLIAASAEDVTASQNDLDTQLAEAKSGKAPPPTVKFVGDEARGRAAWQNILDKGLDHTPKDYFDAIEAGVRVAPSYTDLKGKTKGWFVGDDVQSRQILPKNELPIAGDVYKLSFTRDGKTVTEQFEASLNLVTLLGDPDFKVGLTKEGYQALAKHPLVDTLAPQLLEATSPRMQQALREAGSWKTIIDELVNAVDPMQPFMEGDIRLKPSGVWGHTWDVIRPPIEVRASLTDEDIDAGIRRHKSIIPRAERGLPGRTKQRPLIGGPLFPSILDITPLSPQPRGDPISVFAASTTPDTELTAKTFHRIASRLAKNLKLPGRINVIVANNRNIHELRKEFIVSEDTWMNVASQIGTAWGTMYTTKQGDAFLLVNTDRGFGGIPSPSELYATAMHEFGHAIAYLKFASLPPRLQAMIYAAYRRFVLNYKSPGAGSGHFRRRRQDVMDEFRDPSMDPDYLLSFEEWFAEQVSRWGTSNRTPLTEIGRFFKNLAREIIKAIRAFKKSYPTDTPRAEPEIETWLRHVYENKPLPWGEAVIGRMQQRTRDANLKHGVDSPLHAESVHVNSVIDGFGEKPPAGGETVTAPGPLKAQNDSWWWFYKWMLNFRQLAQLNPHVEPLQRYAEWVEQMQLTANNIMAEAEKRLFEWKALRRINPGNNNQAVRLGKFLFDMNDMVYLRPDEVKKGVRRWPTQVEFESLVKKHGLSKEALQVYVGVRNDFSFVVARQEELSIKEAQRVFATNPDQLQIAIGRAQMLSRRMLAAPYFPMTRFGGWAVTIRTEQGGIEHFETFETKAEQQKAFQEAKRQYPESDGFVVVASTLPEEMKPFVGMPPWFLDKLGEMPGMSQTQIEWLQLLRYEVSPSQSFRKHLLKRRGYAGYSREAERVYAKYFFHHARNYSRLKFQRELDDQIKALRSTFANPDIVAARGGDVNKLTQMADFLEAHMKEVLNPSKDWHVFRSVVSTWFLGASPAAAALNLTQTLLMTWPYLSSKFGGKGLGDVKAAGALMRAAADITTFYRRGSYEGQTNIEMRMLDFLIKQNLITESMAAELAGLAAGSQLTSFAGAFGPVSKDVTTKVYKGWLAGANMAMGMFKLAEQFNRRVTARAAFRLAMENHQAPWLNEVRNRHWLQYTELLKEPGITPREATAILAAKDVILNTQYDYSKIARPRFMQGRKGVLFAFYMFTQNTVFQLMHPENKGVAIRWALVMMTLAGVMGLAPDDLEDIVNFVGKRYFGGDWNVQTETRRLVQYILGDIELPSDLILHGGGRYSFGIPQLMDSIGVSWWPSVDMSRLVALRNILPLPVTGLLNPGVDRERHLSQSLQDLSGAGFGLGFAVYNAITNNELEWGDPKRWEAVMPRAIRAVSRAFRLGAEGGERSGRSNYYMEFDYTNPADMAELAAIGMGFTPTRVSQHWDLQAAQFEVDTFWKAQRQVHLTRLFDAMFKHKDQEMRKEILGDIRRFNKEVPDKKLAISADTIKRSLKLRRERQIKYKRGENPNVSPGIQREMRELFPESRTIYEKRVR